MRSSILAGLTAGAAGTVALNVVTYLDMAIRGRPSSSVPAQMVDTVAMKAEIGLTSADEDEKVLQARESGMGALLGYASGLGIGVLYGVMRPAMDGVPRLLAGVGIGTAAMAASDVPATALGVTNPREWSRASWLADITPHLAYGLVTAVAFDAVKSRR